jgi:hypothetical protein
MCPPLFIDLYSPIFRDLTFECEFKHILNHINNARGAAAIALMLKWSVMQGGLAVPAW